MSDADQPEENVGQLLGRCLRAVGATRVFGSSASGLSGIPGLGHLRVEDEGLASLLADAQGRIAKAGVALLPGRRLRVSSRPGTEVQPLVVDDVELLPEAVAGYAFGGEGGGSGLGAIELVLDLDFDAPVPTGVVPLTMEDGSQFMTLSPSLAEFRMLVLAGPGVVRAGQIDNLQAFAAQAGVGVVNTWGAKGVFAWNSPHHYGTAGMQARDFELAGFDDVQLVIAVGLDPDEAPPERWAQAQVLDVEPWQLGALAYNWPDPTPVPPYPALYTELAAALGPLYDSDASPLTPARAARDLSVVRPAGALIAADAGPAGLWVARTFPTTEPGSVIVPSRAAPGFAVAAAMCASLDQRQAIAITTSPFDPTTDALLELAASFGSSFVLAEWGADADWADANAHKVALRSALAAPGIAHVPVPVDFTWTRTLVEVAGEVIAWGSLSDGERRYAPPEGLRIIFLGLLFVWLLFPFVVRQNLAQDAVPYIVAGELVRTQPDTIYAVDARDLYDLPAPFARRSCEISPPGTNCSTLNVAFVSSPQSIPFAVLLASLGADGGLLLIRMLAALALTGGMYVLWKRLAHRSPRAPAALVASAVLLTPYTVVPVALGQTSPYLFLSACVGVQCTDRWSPSRGSKRSAGAGSTRAMVIAVLVAGLWAFTISLKLFPLALVAILVWQRRFRLVALAVGWIAVLTLGALAFGPFSLFHRFVTASSLLTSYSMDNPYNGSFDVIAHVQGQGTVVTYALFALRVAVVGAIGWWALRHADDDTQWAWAWLAVLLFVPLVWWHYLWLGVAAVGVALAGRPNLDDRWLLALPLVALATVPISLPGADGGAVPWAQFSFLAVTVVLTAWIALDRGKGAVAHAPAG